MKLLTRAALALTLLSGIAIASESNCVETQESNACGLIVRADGYDKTPGGQRTINQDNSNSQALVDMASSLTTA